MKSFYSIFDKKTQQYSDPFVSRSDGEACRSVIASFGSASLLSKFPTDFDLYCLGKFDPDNGQLHESIPTFISNLATLAATQEGPSNG